MDFSKAMQEPRAWTAINYMADEAELPRLDDYNLGVAWQNRSWRDEKSLGTTEGDSQCPPKSVQFYHFTQDESTGALYLDEANSTIRLKHAMLIVPSFFVHFAGVLAMMAMDVVTCSWLCCRACISLLRINQSDLAVCVRQIGVRLVNVMLKPAMWIGLVSSSTMGVAFPLACRKIYGSLERDLYWRGVLAPCFQPLTKLGERQKRLPADCRKCDEDTTAITHLFGAEPNKPGF